MKKRWGVKILIYLPPYSSLRAHAVAVLNIWIACWRCYYAAPMRQQTRLVFNQLHWLCAELFFDAPWPEFGSWLCDSSKNKRRYANLSCQVLEDEWWSGTSALNRQANRRTDRGEPRRCGVSLNHDIISVPSIARTTVSQQSPPSEDVWSHLRLGGHFPLKIAHL